MDLRLLAFALPLASMSLDVLGLRPGESERTVSARPPYSSNLAFGRVIDAVSGAPIAGASLEAWTEDWDSAGAVVDRSSSAADGSFALRREVESVHAEKVRVRASGYRSNVVSFSDLSEELALVPGIAPLVLRVVDVQRRPIAGATLRTHQTCSHAPSACTATSSSDGVLRVPDLPPLDDLGELQLHAPGFESLYDLDIEEHSPATASAMSTWRAAHPRASRYGGSTVRRSPERVCAADPHPSGTRASPMPPDRSSSSRCSTPRCT
ncbi:MAG: carboxypeptidase regulatory-like domain-containing protein [Planctomycetes bacterium]|nr:carboxypeptidase regulatory-like domain-containing protein [Planctomycetota bacterium]